MGLALAAGALAIGGAAYGAYSSNKAAKGAKQNAAGLQKGMAEAMQFVPNVKPVKFDRLSLPDANAAFNSFLSQGDNLGALGKFSGDVAAQDNAAWKSILNRSVPGLSNAVARDRDTLHQSQNLLASSEPLVASRLRGELSAETQANVSRTAAYKSLQGGFGAGSASGRALTSRDLGRTTEDLQTLGFNEVGQFGGMVAQNQASTGNLARMAQFFSPNTGGVGNLLFSPQALLQRDDQQSVFNTQVANSEAAYNTSLDFENQNAKFQALLNSAGVNYQAASAGTAAQYQSDKVIADGLTSAGSALGGMGGGFGNSGGLGSNGAYGSLSGAKSSAPYTNHYSYGGFGQGYIPQATAA